LFNDFLIFIVDSIGIIIFFTGAPEQYKVELYFEGIKKNFKDIIQKLTSFCIKYFYFQLSEQKNFIHSGTHRLNAFTI